MTQTRYEIGVAGNITKETTTTASGTTRSEYDTNALGQTLAITTDGVRREQHYDTSGNLVYAADGTEYSYDITDRPTGQTLPDGTTLSTTYWATGKRATLTTETGNQEHSSELGTPVTEGLETTGFYWDDDTLTNNTHHTVAGGQEAVDPVVSSYLLGATRSAWTHGSSTDYYVGDRHGSIRALTDHHGTPTTTYEYDNYGTTTEHDLATTRDGISNLFAYAGEITDPSGVQVLGDRLYNPTVKAFTTRDTAEQFDLYAYAHANPITLVDPTGQTPDRDTIVNGVSAGLGIMNLFFLGRAITNSLLTASWLAAGVAVVGGIIDAAGTSLAAAELIDDHAEGWNLVRDEISEKLTWAALGLTLAGGGLGLTTRLGRTNAPRLVKVPKGYPRNFDEALNHFNDTPDGNAGLQAWRLMFKKNSVTTRHGEFAQARIWYHGTSTFGAIGIRLLGFRSAARGAANGQAFGPGAYFGRTMYIARGYAKGCFFKDILHITPALRRAVKYESHRDKSFSGSDKHGYIQINPRYSKTANRRARQHIGGHIPGDSEKIGKSSSENGNDATYFADEQYLIIHKEDAVNGHLTTGAMDNYWHSAW